MTDQPVSAGTADDVVIDQSVSAGAVAVVTDQSVSAAWGTT
ncbi:hypothetical protein [Streptomyces sp. NPDC094466]